MLPYILAYARGVLTMVAIAVIVAAIIIVTP
jgi:hypothetical protein